MEGCEIYRFSGQHFEKFWVTDPHRIKSHISEESKVWINIQDINNQTFMEEIKEVFNIHPLIYEDLTHPTQRPKIEFFDDFIFITIRMIYSPNRKLNQVKSEKISLLFGNHFILTFQENPEDVFDPIRARLENPQGKMRKLGTDYFSYTLLDAIIDHYFHILEIIVDEMEHLENKLLNKSKSFQLSAVYTQRKHIEFIRRNIWPIRELLSQWKKSDHHLIRKKNLIYINDAYDHCIEIIENLELQKESVNSLVEMYMAQLNIRQNEVMKTLTIIATIFIPLTFLAGVYGMNFENMPELQWQYGYLYTWVTFVSVTLVLIYYFKKRRWL
ncbi:magnesium/cobalt transporter CorA [Negadavirga shengliensis]|uniref:Magnesium transport protein CorA n=1 Tax=Negadavirga shengliensis TaxID=1389218 RepID=A0ABV9T2Y5_9BACT